MRRFLGSIFDNSNGGESYNPNASPPEWTPATEQSHALGKYEDATPYEYEEAQQFCARLPAERAKLLPSDMVERLSKEGCRPWGMKYPPSPRLKGHVESGSDKGGAGTTKVVVDKKCESVCIFSDLPIIAGLYDTKGKQGVYYEVVIRNMAGLIAIGMTHLLAHDTTLR